MKKGVEVLTAIACEDIRQESNGKIFAVGVLNPVFGVETPSSDAPVPVIKLHFLMSLNVRETGDHTLEFRLRPIKGPGSTTVKMGVIFMETADNIPFPVGPMRVRNPSDNPGLILEQKTGQNRWHELQRWRIDREDGADGN